jgi:acetyl esterase/lipase
MRDSDSTEATHGPPAGARRLRILCLHGYHGSAATLRAQMRGLAEGLLARAEFVCIDAPSLAEGDFGWWHAVDRESDGASDDPGVTVRHKHYKGWARTREAIIAVFARQGPFDGVFGFSQGAALSGLLVGLRAPDDKPTAERPLAFDFAVMVGGFRSNDPAHASLYARADSYNLASLHMLGRADTIVPNESSRALAACFPGAIFVEHDGGHVIASDRESCARVGAFLDEARARIDARATLRADAAAMANPLEIALWSGRAAPTMRVLGASAHRKGLSPALVILRGGGYATSSGSGAGTAKWAALHGMIGVEVAYRTQATGDAHPKGYADAARAVRLVREHAAAWGVDPTRIGVLGYSAGGHLASLLSTQPSLYIDPDDDLAPRISARPDFVVLGYPLISFIEGYHPGAFAGSAESFFGRRDLDEEQRRRFSNELHVTPDHPPVFLWTTEDDNLVPASHSRLFAEACRRAHVPVTFELFPHGAHGLGLALEEEGEVQTWTEKLLRWLSVTAKLPPHP